MSDKSWEPEMFWKTHTPTLRHSFSLSHSFNLSFNHSWHAEQLLFSSLCSKLTLTLSHSHTLSISHSLTLDMLNNFCFHVYAQKSFSHSLTVTLTLSHSHSFSLSHSFNLSFNHSRHAEQLLFSCLSSKVTLYRWKWQCFLYHSLITKLHHRGSIFQSRRGSGRGGQWPRGLGPGRVKLSG